MKKYKIKYVTSFRKAELIKQIEEAKASKGQIRVDIQVLSSRYYCLHFYKTEVLTK